MSIVLYFNLKRSSLSLSLFCCYNDRYIFITVKYIRHKKSARFRKTNYANQSVRDGNFPQHEIAKVRSKLFISGEHPIRGTALVISNCRYDFLLNVRRNNCRV